MQHEILFSIYNTVTTVYSDTLRLESFLLFSDMTWRKLFSQTGLMQTDKLKQQETCRRYHISQFTISEIPHY